MGVAKKVLYSVGGGKVKESLLTVDDSTGAVVAPAGLTVTTGGLLVSAGGIDITGSAQLKSGAAITGANLTMGGNKITGLNTAAPTADGDAANKKYVDDQVAALGTNSHTYTGFDNTTAGLTIGALVALNTAATGDSDRLVLASNAAETTAQVIGVVVNTVGTTSSESVTVLSDGYATSKTDLASIDPGKILYLGTAGGVTETAPSASGTVIVIAGYVADKANDKVHFQIRGFQQN